MANLLNQHTSGMVSIRNSGSLTLGRQLSSRVWLAHRRTGNSVESVVALKIDESPPTARDWQLLGSPVRIDVIRDERFLVADMLEHEEASPFVATPEVAVPRLRPVDDGPGFSVADIMNLRENRTDSPTQATVAARVGYFLRAKRKMVAFSTGVAAVAIVCGVMFLPHTSQSQSTDTAGEVRPIMTEGPEPRQTEQPSPVDASTEVNSQWFIRELSETPITAQAALLSKYLGWKSGMEIASRELSRTGDVGMYEVCTINVQAQPTCAQVVTESAGKETEIREIVRPAT